MNKLSSQRISWSKTGIIAYGDSYSNEGNLCITFLETINGVNCRFHPPKRYTIHPQIHETLPKSDGSTSNHNVNGSNGHTSGGTPASSSKHSHQFFYDISSVHWNNWFSLPGDMLAVCDELGNMTMLIAGQSPDGPTTLDKLTMLFQDNIYKIHNHVMQLQTTNASNTRLERKQTKKEYNTTILDFHWLSSSKPVIISQFSAFDSSINMYRNKAQQLTPHGIYHPPFMKYACLAVRRNGQVDFWYQFSNSKDHKKITLQLFNPHNERSRGFDFLQYAKITPVNNDNCLLITTYSRLTKKLSFYKLFVNWNISAAKPVVLNDPALKFKHILDATLDQTDGEGRILEFSCVHVLAKVVVDKDTAPEVLVVYDVLGTNESIVKQYKLGQVRLPLDYLGILKPELNTSNENHNQALRSNRSNLRFLGSLHLKHKVMNVTSEILDGFISFYYTNGDIDVYNQNDWKLETERLVNQGPQGKFSNIITSILSAGFKYKKVETIGAVEWIRVSPTMAGIIYKNKKDDQPKFYPMYLDDVADKSKDEINATSMAFGYVTSAHRQLSGEDIALACKQHILKIAKLDEKRAKNFITTLMFNLYNFFNFSPGAPKELMDKIISSRPLQKVMLLQLELGSIFSDENTCEMARVILYLKNVSFAFNGVARNLQFAIEQMTNSTNTASSSTQLSGDKFFQTAFSKQDLVHSLIPVTKWFVKFITYLIQQILILTNDPENSENRLVLGIFGAKIPRTLILTILSEIQKVIAIITKFPETNYPILNESSTFLKMVLAESPVNFEKFGTFLNDVNLKLSTFSEQQPSVMREPTLLVRSEVPEELSKITEFLLQYSSNTVISHGDAAAIYFADTSGLRISCDEFFQPGVHKLLQPIERGIVISNDQMPPALQDSDSFTKLTYDGITYDRFTPEELEDKKLKRCNRCGCVTKAGYPIARNKTIVPTSISTRRWPTMYTRMCICSGMLYEL
ncbi:Mediator of RNA polymerase II transcription subunit 16 [Nakaseomyces bracarensis]|uniref:Mediator of RNA polymerase II transcription subunit 16 n=1 Tax=Nakaseomyces bracarensis TaxID=273131 RepID=A0ABR4NYI6_9SACH